MKEELKTVFEIFKSMEFYPMILEPIEFQRDMTAVALVAQNAIDQIDEGIEANKIRQRFKKVAKRFQEQATPFTEGMFATIIPESRDQFLQGMQAIEEQNKPNLTDNLNLIIRFSLDSNNVYVPILTRKLVKCAEQVLKHRNELPKPVFNAQQVAESLLKMIKIQRHE